MNKIEGKITLVTGGNSGIGLARAKAFGNEGAYVFITGRREAELAAAVKEIGRNVTGIQGDVSNLGDVFVDGGFAQVWANSFEKGDSPMRRLDIRAGDPQDADIEDGRIVLTRGKRPHRGKLVTDPITGLPALSAGANAPPLSSKEVEEILSNFP